MGMSLRIQMGAMGMGEGSGGRDEELGSRCNGKGRGGGGGNYLCLRDLGRCWMGGWSGLSDCWIWEDVGWVFGW